MIFHNLAALISVGVDITDEDDVFVAFAACNRKDQPTRKRANEILNGRLKSNSTLYMGGYTGEDAGADVFGRIRDTVRDLSIRRNFDTLPVLILNSLRKESTKWFDGEQTNKTTEASVTSCGCIDECCSA